ncbi:MAG: hypothetical protein NXY57DRAFT_1065368, partial [Lentinula lateritia]
MLPSLPSYQYSLNLEADASYSGFVDIYFSSKLKPRGWVARILPYKSLSERFICSLLTFIFLPPGTTRQAAPYLAHLRELISYMSPSKSLSERFICSLSTFIFLPPGTMREVALYLAICRHPNRFPNDSFAPCRHSFSSLPPGTTRQAALYPATCSHPHRFPNASFAPCQHSFPSHLEPPGRLPRILLYIAIQIAFRMIYLLPVDIHFPPTWNHQAGCPVSCHPNCVPNDSFALYRHSFPSHLEPPG